MHNISNSCYPQIVLHLCLHSFAYIVRLFCFGCIFLHVWPQLYTADCGYMMWQTSNTFTLAQRVHIEHWRRGATASFDLPPSTTRRANKHRWTASRQQDVRTVEPVVIAEQRLTFKRRLTTLEKDLVAADRIGE